MKNEQELLSVKQTAELLGVSPSTVRKWANLEEIQAVFDKATGNRMFRLEEVLKLKSKLQVIDYNSSYVGFGIDKLNQFSNSVYGKILKYLFVIIFLALLFFGVYIIVNLQSEVRALKRVTTNNYKVVDFNDETSTNNTFLKKDDIGNVINLKQTNKNSYGKLILNIDDNLLKIIEKAQLSGDDELGLKVDEKKLEELKTQQIISEFMISSSTKIVNKSTMKDTLTGKIYCVSVNNGKLVTIEGSCLD